MSHYHKSAKDSPPSCPKMLRPPPLTNQYADSTEPAIKRKYREFPTFLVFIYMSWVSKKTRPNSMQSNIEYIGFMSWLSKDAFLIDISKVQHYLNYMSWLSKCTTQNTAYYIGFMSWVSKDTKKLYQVISELTDSVKVEQWPEHTSKEQLANSFADFFLDKIVNIRKMLEGFNKLEIDKDHSIYACEWSREQRHHNLSRLMSALGFTQLINKVTHNSRNTLDLVFIEEDPGIGKHVVDTYVDEFLSDHRPVFFKLSVKKPTMTSKICNIEENLRRHSQQATTPSLLWWAM